MVVVKRYTQSGMGWYFGNPIKEFTEIKLINCMNTYIKIEFEYYGKKHELRLYSGKYGLNFILGNSTYYVLKGEENE